MLANKTIRCNSSWKDVKNPERGRKILRELYWSSKLSSKDIGKLFNKTDRSVLHYMREYNIPRRNISKAVSIAKTTFALPFSGNLVEKAYMIGLRFSDLAASRARRKIRVSVETTHLAMIELFKKTFRDYVDVKLIPRFRKQIKIGSEYRWECYCYLDESFRFLLRKGELPNWIKSNVKCFTPFLAGFVDGDGYIEISPHRDRIAIRLGIGSVNRIVLNDIKDKLVEMGFHPTLRLVKKRETSSGLFRLNKDLWSLRMLRKDEVVRLFRELPLSHDEKVLKKEIALKARKLKYWLEIKEEIIRFRRKIKKEVELCIKKAEKTWGEKHGAQ